MPNDRIVVYDELGRIRNKEFIAVLRNNSKRTWQEFEKQRQHKDTIFQGRDSSLESLKYTSKILTTIRR
jgi:hypothetical protein